MIIISFGKWTTEFNNKFIKERIYLNGYWTPFCKIQKRDIYEKLYNLINENNNNITKRIEKIEEEIMSIKIGLKQ